MRLPAKWILLIVAALLVAVTVDADILILRDGRRIAGQLISVRNGEIEFGEGQSGFGNGRILRVDRDAVLGIEFQRYGREGSSNSGPRESFGRRGSGLRERQVMVAANVQWTGTNIDVRAGQDVYFDASGEVRWGPSRRDGPAGEQNSPINPSRPMPNRPGAALIGRVGENSNDYFFIGADRGPIRMRSTGRLFLGVNDDYLQDNSGFFRIVVYY